MATCSCVEAFEASVDGVKLEIPVLKLSGWSKATADEQKTISSYWGNGDLGTFYPAVIAHGRDGAPLFVFTAMQQGFKGKRKDSALGGFSARNARFAG